MECSGSHVYRRDGIGVTDPLLNDGTAEYTPGISRPSSTGTLFYGSDRMGSNVMQTDSSQNVSSTSQFDAFGNFVASTGSPQGPLGFNGQYGYQTDQDTGFQLLGHRYYDPSTGRFLTRDPAKDGENWYDYCANNPLQWVDASGFDTLIGKEAGNEGEYEGKQHWYPHRGLPDCGGFVRQIFQGLDYPCPAPPRGANGWPGAFRKDPKHWHQIPTNRKGKYPPGTVIIIQRKGHHGHVIIVGKDGKGYSASMPYGRYPKGREPGPWSGRLPYGPGVTAWYPGPVKPNKPPKTGK